MNQEIHKALIEKYLAGADLTQEETALIQPALQGRDEDLLRTMDGMVPAQDWNPALLGGIWYAGEQRLKQKLSIASDDLRKDGFFLDEEDIDAWIKGELAPDKEAIFEKRMNEDASFAQQVEAEKKMLAGIDQYGKEQLKMKIGRARKSLETEGFFNENTEKATGEAKIVSIGRRRLWLAVAAAAVLLIAAAIWSFLHRTPDPEVLYAQHFTAYPDKISEPIREDLNAPGFGNNPEEIAKWQEFLAAMQTYPQNVPDLQAFTEKYPQEHIARFYLAQAQMTGGMLDAAKTNFEVLEKDKDFEERWAVKWSLALIHLKQNNLARSKELLEELKRSASGDYGEKASRLLEKLP